MEINCSPKHGPEAALTQHKPCSGSSSPDHPAGDTHTHIRRTWLISAVVGGLLALLHGQHGRHLAVTSLSSVSGVVCCCLTLALLCYVSFTVRAPPPNKQQKQLRPAKQADACAHACTTHELSPPRTHPPIHPCRCVLLCFCSIPR